MSHHRVLWGLQWLVGLYFIAIGVMHFIVPEGLPTQLSWMYELDDSLHAVSGVAEILGGLGLIVPSLTRVAPWLTPLAALGLMVVMVGAVIWHAARGEVVNIAVNVVNLGVLGYIAYGRWRLVPIEPR
ncbi:MAG TPA: DoxX family protein [Acidimicrobiia bacterium]|nr:DoxX family protein [Acidimicrobiia bacterium]